MPGEEQEVIGPASAIADGTLVALTLWISVLFWRSYRRLGEKRNLHLGLTFFAVAIFKTVQLVFDKILGFESLAWMDSNLASELQIILLSGVLIWAISPKTSSGTKAQPRPEYDRRAA